MFSIVYEIYTGMIRVRFWLGSVGKNEIEVQGSSEGCVTLMVKVRHQVQRPGLHLGLGIR